MSVFVNQDCFVSDNFNIFLFFWFKSQDYWQPLQVFHVILYYDH